MFNPAQPIRLQTDDFVDRREELDVLIQMACGASPYRVYMVQGPEGIGKSFLIKEFRAQCQAAGIACARVLPELAEDTNYLSIVGTIWEDLKLGTAADLYKQIAQARAARLIQKVRLPDVEPGEVALEFLGDPSIYGNINTGKVGGNMNYQMVMQMLDNDHDKARKEVKDVITPFLKECLVSFTTNRRAIFLVDPWEAACRDDQTMNWLVKTLVGWVLEGEVPNAALAVAGGQLPLLTQSLKRIYHTELGSLPDEAVCSYWIDKGLPAGDLPEVIKITNGIPKVLSLTAYQASITGHLEPGHNSSPPGAGDIAAHAIDSLLVIMPAELSRAIRLCSIPHWFNRELFFALMDPPGGSQAVFDQLIDLRIVEPCGQDLYCFSESVRRYLLANWWHLEKRAEYIEKSRAVLAYLQGFKRQSSARQVWSIEQEILYFQLIVEEASGIQALRDRFEITARHQQLDLAEQFFRKAQELESYLSTGGRLWLHYFEDRVNLFTNQVEKARTDLDVLLNETQDQVLQAAILWTRARILVGQQRWSQAAGSLDDALDLLDKAPCSLYELLVKISLAETYSDLAHNSGGLQPEGDRFNQRKGGWLNVLQHLPFMVFESLVHRWSFLPNVYFGTNYQNWIISYLLMKAAHWYRKAKDALEEGLEPLWLFDIQLGLAGVEHQLGRWSLAKKRYAELEKMDLVKNSAYRMALVSLGSGQALAEEGRLKTATGKLEEALPALDHYKDWEQAGMAHACLSQVHRSLGCIDASASAGLETVRNFQDAGKPIQATQMICDLEDLAANPDLKEQAGPVKGMVESEAARHYLARFPEILLGWYKRVALLGAMPLTYFLFIILSFLAGIAILVIDGEVGLMQAGFYTGTSLRDGLIILSIILLPILLALWTYRFFYSLIGLRVVSSLGRRMDPIEAEQPRQFILKRESIQYTDKSGAKQELAWNDIQRVGVDSQRLLSREINLVSRTILVPSDRSRNQVDIEGITAGYDHLKKDILRRLQASRSTAETLWLDFQLFNPRWAVASLLFSLAVLGYLIATHRICGTYGTNVAGQEVLTFIGPCAFNFLPLLALTLCAQISWRSLVHVRRVARELERSPKTFPAWQHWFAACFTTLVQLSWLFVILTQHVCRAAGSASF